MAPPVEVLKSVQQKSVVSLPFDQKILPLRLLDEHIFSVVELGPFLDNFVEILKPQKNASMLLAAGDILDP